MKGPVGRLYQAASDEALNHPTVQYPGPYATAFEYGLCLVTCFLQMEYGQSDGISLLRLGYK